MYNSLRDRQREPELMDQPGLDERLHGGALRGLRRINRVSRSGGIVWSALARLFATDTLRPWRVLDLASGGGDVAIEIARRALRQNVNLHVDGCDISPFAVRYAADQARKMRVGNVGFFEHDVLSPLPVNYDVVMCSLFLHHLEGQIAVGLLSRMAASARRLVLVNDLRRSRLGYAAVWLGCRLLTRSPLVRVDGPRSIQAAFSIAEMREMAGRAGLERASVESRWPCRLLLQWSAA